MEIELDIGESAPLEEDVNKRVYILRAILTSEQEHELINKKKNNKIKVFVKEW